MPGGGWSVSHRLSATLPAMAWVLRARPPVAELTFGSGVRPTDAGIFEGTWVGDDGDDLAPLRSTTPFGSGVLIDRAGLSIVPPGHTLEGVYVCRRPNELVASNSFAGLVAAAGLELDPRVLYPPLFQRSVDGVKHTLIPTTTDPIRAVFHDNLRLDLDGGMTGLPKPRERPFATFEEHRARLSEALASALANAPSHEPVVTISSGYDGAAVAVLATELGCRRAVTVRQGKPVPRSAILDDGGEEVGRMLGMDVASFERLAYLRRDDLPEAEFLAAGFTGEEVVMSEMEQDLRGRMLVTAFFGDGMWWMNRPPRPSLWRSDQSGSSLGEWRLRNGFIHVPLPVLGAQHYRTTQGISRSPGMRPWVLGRAYDKPIPRRILEDAGVRRGSFGEVKRAISGTIHVDGPEALSPPTLAALREFAAAQGEGVSFKRRRFPAWDRALLKASRRIGAESIAWRVEQRKFLLGAFEPVFGSLVVRWAISEVQPRYAEVARPSLAP